MWNFDSILRLGFRSCLRPPRRRSDEISIFAPSKTSKKNADPGDLQIPDPEDARYSELVGTSRKCKSVSNSEAVADSLALAVGSLQSRPWPACRDLTCLRGRSTAWRLDTASFARTATLGGALGDTATERRAARPAVADSSASRRNRS